MSRASKTIEPIRIVRLFVAAVMVALAVVPVLASPAGACSCGGVRSIEEWVDGSEAVFVGRLIEKRGDQFNGEAIYVFEVEHWAKGDLGEIIEVRSAANGAACGFEFWDPDQRIGAAIHQENGELHGSLCSQVDAEVLLAAVRGPTPSATGIGRLLVGHGWSSSQLTILDDVGAHVADLSPPGPDMEWDGTQGLEICPGGDLMIQWTQTRVVVWDLDSLQPTATHEITGDDGYPVIRAASCNSDDASSIWIAGANEFQAELLEVSGDTTTPMLELEGHHFSIGSDFVVSQPDHEQDATWIDLANGEQTVLTDTPPDQLRAVSVATHPTERLLAVVETDFNEGGPVHATLSIMDETGSRLHEFEIPWETYSPTWLDESRVAVKAYNFNNWDQVFGFIFDLNSGEVTEIEGWEAEYTVADGDQLYGVSGSDIIATDLSTQQVETLVTVASESAGPILLLNNDARPSAPTTTTAPEVSEVPGNTTPPLVAPEVGREIGDTDTVSIRWIAGGAMVAFLGLLAWLGSHRPRSHEDSS